MFLSSACFFILIKHLICFSCKVLLTGQVYAAQEKGNHRSTSKAPRQLLTKAWVRSHWETTTGNSTKPLLAQTMATPWECHSLQESTMLVEEVWTMFTPLFSFTFTMDQTTRWDRSTLWMANIMPLRWVNKCLIFHAKRKNETVHELSGYLRKKWNINLLVFLKFKVVLFECNLFNFYHRAFYSFHCICMQPSFYLRLLTKSHRNASLIFNELVSTEKIELLLYKKKHTCRKQSNDNADNWSYLQSLAQVFLICKLS